MSHVVVGMSGGVDSSVAALKLLENGERVTGLFMKNWEEDDRAEYCAAAEDLADAEAVCQRLGIPLRSVNFAHEYWERVFKLFLDEYRSGRTPNPDVLCNKEIKFKEFLEFAQHLGADYIATGHYAQLQPHAQGYRLCRGLDAHKDQSYFLHAIGQHALKLARFPVGDMHKSQVRATAKKLGLPTHDKKDSTGICFIGERRFRDFLARFLPAKPGEVRTLDGEVVGQHHGAFYYTIGQRRGLGIGGDGEAWYVADKDTARNIVYAVQGHAHPALKKRVLDTDAVHWIADQPPSIPFACTAKTRYRQDDHECVITELRADGARVEFAQPQWAVTPGQSVVFYQREICLGGAIIRATRDN